MVLQDFRTWTETDPDTCLTVTEKRVTWTAADGDHDSYVIRDYGSAIFIGDFTHRFKFEITDMENGGSCATYGIGAAADISGGNDFICGVSGSSVAAFTLLLARADFGSFDASAALAVDTLYFVTVTRTGTDVNLVIDTGGYGDTNVDTITISLVAADAYRYIITFRDD